MNYKEFEKMIIDLYIQEIKYQQKLWLFDLDFMEKWEPSEFTNKGEKDVMP